VTRVPAAALTVRRTIGRPRDEVFRAWTDPDALVSWFGGAKARTLTAAVDLRAGGSYRFTVESGGEVAAVEGVYREVEPPERLVYTWRWDREELDGGRESLVTVEFRDRGGSTEVVLTHEGLENTDPVLRFHDRGWAASLDRLERTPPEAGGGGTPVLWHLKVSNYNEKARWALDHKRIPHVRRAVDPPAHRAIARKLSGGTTFPVLELDGEAVGDSTRIIEALERRQPDPPLYPSDPAARRRALELEDFFDEELGPYVRLLAVHHLMASPRLMLAVFTPDLRPGRRLATRAMFPVMRRQLRAGFGIDDVSVEQAYQKVHAAGERFRAELQPSGYLVGDGFTVADLTLAALVSPMVAPEQFPYPQPQRGHPLLARLREALAEEGILDWTREMYARHRGRSAEVPAPA
jgi:glutathione S-transferase